MKRLWQATVATIVISALAALQAAEPYLEFVEGLRRNGYHDYAILYLEELEQRAKVPAEIKEIIPFEKAATLLDGAPQVRSPDAQMKQYDQARAYLEQFLKASPNHAQAAQANAELAQVYVGKGRVEVIHSRSPANVAQKADYQKRAREYFGEARKVFQAAHDKFKDEWDKYDRFIPKTEKERYEAREKAYLNYMQAQLHLALLIYEEAQTYDKGSAENRKLLTDAANAFEQINAKYRQQVAGLHARKWQGKCFEEQGDFTKALGIYNELLDHGKEGEKPPADLKRLQDQVLGFKLICLNDDKRKDFQVVKDLAEPWIKQNRNLLASTSGLRIQWELVRALVSLSKKEGIHETEKNRHLQQALTTARAINRYPGELRDASTAMIQKLMVELDREPGDPKDFASAFNLGRTMIEDVRNRNKQIDAAKGAERDKLVADLQPVLKEVIRVLNIALSLAGPKDDLKDVNKARYFLAYAYYSLREQTPEGLRDYTYESAVLSEFVARKYSESQPEVALDSAYLGLAAYQRAMGREPEDQRGDSIQRIIGLCDFITRHWPDSDNANEARMNLGALFTQLERPDEAAKWYMQVPEASPRYLEAQLAAGNAYWLAYLVESIRPEAERKPKAELDEQLKKSRDILQGAITKFEAQLPKDPAQVERQKLASLTRAKLSYAQILNSSGDYKAALGLLVEGPLSATAAVAPPGGDEKQRGTGVDSRKSASAVYQQVLRSYVGLQDLDKARGAMKALEKIEGAGGGGAALTQIFLQLGRELEKEVKRLQSAKEPRLSDVLKSFETFLDDMYRRQEGQDFNSLYWIAETYRALGEGVESGDAAKSAGYFGKAIDAFRTILDTDSKKPGFIPGGTASGVQLRMVMCQRRRKSFDEAEKAIVSILKARPRAIDAQIEAAQIYQDWAARGSKGDVDRWKIAIEGDMADKKKKDGERVVWGWKGIADRLQTTIMQARDPNEEYQQQYLDARYGVASCRLQEARAQSTRQKREPLLEAAKSDVLATMAVSPELGGGDSWEKFNDLYREIQKDLIAENIQKTPVANLEKRVAPSSLASADTKKKAAAKRKAAATAGQSDGKNGEKQAAAGGGGMIWIVAGLVLVVAVGGAAWFTMKKKPGSRIFIPDEAPEFETVRKPPTTKARG